MAIFRSLCSSSDVLNVSQTYGVTLSDRAVGITGVNTAGDYILFRGLPAKSVVTDWCIVATDGDSGAGALRHDLVLTKVGYGGLAADDILIADALSVASTGGTVRKTGALLAGVSRFKKTGTSASGDYYQLALRVDTAASTPQAFDVEVTVTVEVSGILYNVVA